MPLAKARTTACCRVFPGTTGGQEHQQKTQRLTEELPGMQIERMAPPLVDISHFTEDEAFEAAR